MAFNCTSCIARSKEGERYPLSAYGNACVPSVSSQKAPYIFQVSETILDFPNS